MAMPAVGAVGHSQRPLVVLAGWLGCQPRNLRRYEELHKKLGCNVISRIATPVQVVQTVLRYPSTVSIPPDWPERMQCVRSMQDLAWDLLREIHESDPPVFIFHAFSNGGCFLWEETRRILDLCESSSAGSTKDSKKHEEADLLSPHATAALLRIQTRLAGVVFDSCPGADLSRLDQAMEYCSWTEKFDVYRKIGWDYARMKSASMRQNLLEREQGYRQKWRQDPWPTPQLYLYSRDDVLAPADYLDDLVQHRENLLGSDRIFSHCWESSSHCGHLLRHSQDYTQAVENFVEKCLELRKIRSKM